MTIKDALKEINAPDGILIMYRMLVPVPKTEEVYDELIGYCRYCKKGRGGKLVSEDGDTYGGLDTPIDGHRYVSATKKDEEYLIIWEKLAQIDFTIKGRWFDMIRRGEKKEEYREIKEYWYTRFRKIFPFVKNTTIPLEKEDRRWALFRNGYGKDRPSFYAEVSLKRGQGRQEWGAEEGKEYYVLTVHNIIPSERIRNILGKELSIPAEAPSDAWFLD